MYEQCFGEGPFVFRVNDNGSGPQLLTQVCLERGWREYNPECNEHWNLWWRTSGFPISHHRTLYSWQFINHIPKGSAICRKDNLARYLRCMKKVYGSIYDFSPHGYNLPLEYTKLAAECSRIRALAAKDDEDLELQDESPVWIYKPVSQSQGRGIFLFRKLSDLTYDANAIVQRYIEKPLLIGGYKFDLRLYVCVPSYHPVTIYMYREGLTRFGTDKFSLNDLRNPFRHLTNSSLNKLGPGYSEMKDRIGSGCKWTLRQLRIYFQQAGISDWLLWQRISCLVVLTVLSHVTQVPPTVNCFEFFGFDVLVDSTLRPWLLEVNLSPALGNDCDADRTVKKPMLHDMFDLLGLPLYNTGLSVFTVWTDETSNSSCICCDSENSSEEKLPTRRKSTAISVNKTLVKPVTYKPNFSDPLSQSKQASDEARKTFDNKCWGNGRDWERAPTNEGGWVRIWPMGQVENKSNIKNMVGQITKFSKTAKDIPKRYPMASEAQWNEILKQSLNLTTDIWYPIK
ncbi:Tubulin tyrosine ligase-like 5 [Carabus blaptoides fortunei]